jgi:deoxycytidylate deaminase
MPCPSCALQIAQHKVAKVVIPEDWNNIAMIREEDIKLSKFIFAQAGIVFQIHDKVINLESNTVHDNHATKILKKSGPLPFGFGRDLPPKY